MKKLLFLFLSLISLSVFAQEPKLKLATDSTKINVNGTPIMKGDEFIVQVLLDGNGNTTSRSLYFDFEIQNTAFELISLNHTGTGGNGGVLPYGSSNITLDTYQYPGYSWVSNENNTTSNGNQNYQNQAYSYTQGGPKTIIRAYLNWSSPNGLPYQGYAHLLTLRFRLKSTAIGDTWDPIKMNFAASFNGDGSTGAAINETPKTSVITLNPDANKLVKAVVDLNGNVTNTDFKVGFLKTTDNTMQLFDVAATGAVNIVDSLLVPNTEYKIMVMANMDKIVNYSNSAVTISDYTTVVQEFVSQNLDGTYKNNNIMTGMGFWAADVNRSNKLDGGDAPRILASVGSVASMVTLPTGYTVGNNGWMSLPTFKASDFNDVSPAQVFAVLPTNLPAVYTYTTPPTRGTPSTITIKYLFRGDVNRSHSSQVVQGGQVKTNAIPSLNKSLYKLAQNIPTANLMINPSQTAVASVDVNLTNLTVTSNTIEIPITISSGTDISALQFEFAYDTSKLKFETVTSNVPNTWYTFASAEGGKVKFGALDQNLKTYINGTLTPFKVKFTALQNGLDINSFVKITQAVDAADKNGSQMNINLNTDKIKLTGYNNF